MLFVVAFVLVYTYNLVPRSIFLLFAIRVKILFDVFMMIIVIRFSIHSGLVWEPQIRFSHFKTRTMPTSSR